MPEIIDDDDQMVSPGGGFGRTIARLTEAQREVVEARNESDKALFQLHQRQLAEARVAWPKFIGVMSLLAYALLKLGVALTVAAADRVEGAADAFGITGLVCLGIIALEHISRKSRRRHR